MSVADGVKSGGWGRARKLVEQAVAHRANWRALGDDLPWLPNLIGQQAAGLEGGQGSQGYGQGGVLPGAMFRCLEEGPFMMMGRLTDRFCRQVERAGRPLRGLFEAATTAVANLPRLVALSLEECHRKRQMQ